KALVFQWFASGGRLGRCLIRGVNQTPKQTPSDFPPEFRQGADGLPPIEHVPPACPPPGREVGGSVVVPQRRTRRLTRTGVPGCAARPRALRHSPSGRGLVS